MVSSSGVTDALWPAKDAAETFGVTENVSNEDAVAIGGDEREERLDRIAASSAENANKLLKSIIPEHSIVYLTCQNNRVNQ